tara:strand:+ start:15606 stop:16769 length:1164 start_codon:yes stop_codon:yes gene_type:complete
LISYGKQSIDSRDIEAVVSVLKGDWLTQGPYVENFENDLKNYFGSKYSCAVANGTAALHLAGLALGWESGDIIVTSPITFLASANSIIYSDGTPDFVDIDSSSFTIDPNLLEEKLIAYNSKGQKIKAVIGIDFAGHPCDWKSLNYLSKKYNFQLINDNCHALGAAYNNDITYAAKYADIVIQSFHPVKHITTGEGGSVLTNNIEIIEEVELYRTHGMTKDRSRLEKNDGPWYYEMHKVGFNYRLTDFQAALGSSQLKKLDKFVKKRTNIANFYDEFFLQFENIYSPQRDNSINHSFHLYPLKINFEKFSISKSEFFRQLRTEGINLQVHYIPVHLQPFYKKNFKFNKGDFPISENFYEQEISLPIFPDLSEDDLKFVCNKIKNILFE